MKKKLLTILVLLNMVGCVKLSPEQRYKFWGAVSETADKADGKDDVPDDPAEAEKELNK